jgi:copper chaperone CopZ
MAEIKIKTTGMDCHGCEVNIQDSVSELPGIKKVKADFKKAVVEVKFDDKLVNSEQIKQAIKAAGYTPE